MAIDFAGFESHRILITSSLFHSRKLIAGWHLTSDKGRVEAPLWQTFSARFVTSVKIRHGEQEKCARTIGWDHRRE
jgi:hypothetical protein